MLAAAGSPTFPVYLCSPARFSRISGAAALTVATKKAVSSASCVSAPIWVKRALVVALA